jgi:hypothetical protein
MQTHLHQKILVYNSNYMDCQNKIIFLLHHFILLDIIAVLKKHQMP